MSNKALFKLHYSAGRMGDLNGVFIATKHQVEWLTGTNKDVYFGEVLGKHSEIYGPVETGDITFITDKPDVIEIVEEHQLLVGYDPFDYCFITEHAKELLGDKYEDDLTALEVYNILHPQTT